METGMDVAVLDIRERTNDAMSKSESIRNQLTVGMRATS